jgi:NADH-quinone oxidoreductase subunit M
MNPSPFPLLSLIIALPLAGAILVAACQQVRLAKLIALVVALSELLLTLTAVFRFDPTNAEFQLVERYSWIPALNIDFYLGADGISILFLPMTAMLVLLTLIASWNSIHHLPRCHFALLLALESITMGVFSALDLILFFLFWELTLPPIFFLISLWGLGPRRRNAAMKYVIYMLAGGLPLLFAIVWLATHPTADTGGAIPDSLSFSLPELQTMSLPEQTERVVFLLLLTGFAIKAPLPPFHTWLPTVSMEAPSQLSALLIGLKLGVFGILRLAMPLAPSAAVEYSWALGIAGAITLIYCALIALQQTNLRRLLAYASISHVGLVIIGLASLNPQSLHGAILGLINATLISGSLMLIAGFIHHRLGSTELIHLGGLAKTAPRLACFYFLFIFASIGLPGTSGFPAEFLLITGALLAHPSLGIAALTGAVLTAAYLLTFSRRAFWGPLRLKGSSQMPDLRVREIALLTLPALLTISFGLLPNYLLDFNRKTSERWLSRLVEQPEAEKAAPAVTRP